MQPTLIIGATGMLGRPVTRRLVADGLPVRALVRDVERARTLLPGEADLIEGDLRDEAKLEAAMEGAGAVYLSLNNTMARRRPAWDPDADGTPAVLGAAARAGVPRILKLSALGVEPMQGRWWVAAAKIQADRLVLDSKPGATVFRPPWLMESIPTLRMGRFYLLPDPGAGPIPWITGSDYGAVVAAALRDPSLPSGIVPLIGTQRMTIAEAIGRFRSVRRSGPRIPVFRWQLRLGAALSGKAAYLERLMAMTRDHLTDPRLAGTPEFDRLCTSTIEDYARSLAETGDVPSKR